MLLAVEECQPTIHMSVSLCCGRLIEITHPENTVAKVAGSTLTLPKVKDRELRGHCSSSTTFEEIGCSIIALWQEDGRYGRRDWFSMPLV